MAEGMWGHAVPLLSWGPWAPVVPHAGGGTSARGKHQSEKGVVLTYLLPSDPCASPKCT